MGLFCLLWIPAFYCFRRSITAGNGGGSGVLALLLGCVAVVFQYIAGPLVTPGGFGVSRWVSGFVDVVSLPALIPIIAYFLLVALRVLPAGVDLVNFTLLWLIPVAVSRSLSWTSESPLMLVLVPLLWTAQGAGIPFFVSGIMQRRWFVCVPLSLGAVAIPIIAATSWWAFYSHQFSVGYLLLIISLVPAMVSVVFACVRRKSGQFLPPAQHI
jgi:hypothetical protein